MGISLKLGIAQDLWRVNHFPSDLILTQLELADYVYKTLTTENT